MQATDQVSNLLAVCDGKFYWRHVDTGGQPSLERVDLARVQKALDEKSQTSGAGQGRGAAPTIGISLGGLPALLAGLADNFVFAEVEQDSLDRLPVSVLRGEWRKERLAELGAAAASGIPGGTAGRSRRAPVAAPHQVSVYLGRDDLFPYRLEYFRTPSKKDPGYDPASRQPADDRRDGAFEVQANVALPEATFQYLATGRQFVDATERYVK